MQDMRDIVRKPRNWVGTMVVIMVLIALIQSFLSSANTNLPAYVATPTPEPTATPPSIETVTYQSNEINFTMLVPGEWEFVTKSGNDAFINPVDGAMLMIDIYDYDPSLNNVTQETVYSDVVATNGVLGGFASNTTSSYVVIYEIGSADYFEYHCWDRSHAICISMTVPAERYNYYYDSVIYLFDSISWQQEYPITDGYYLYYSDYGNFEFGIPTNWDVGLENGELVMVSPNGSTVVVSLTSTSNDLSGVSKLDYANSMSGGKSNYLLSTFENTGSTLTAEASFTANNVSYSEVRMILSTGTFWYEFNLTCPSSAYDTDGATFLNIVNLFRVLSE